MFNCNTTLSGIDFKVRKLIEKHNHIEKELAEMKQKNQILLETIEKQVITINKLEDQNKILKLRNTLDTTKGDSAEIKLKINQLIREIDKSITLLTRVE